MRVGTITIVGALAFAGVAHSEADIRAVDACKAGGKAFTEIASCLPDADVSFKTLDAFSAVYPKEAEPLKTKCIELNTGNILGASTCVKEAIKASLELKAVLPYGQNLGDPVFTSVSDPQLKTKFDAEIKKAQQMYPNKVIWGGTMYHAYK